MLVSKRLCAAYGQGVDAGLLQFGPGSLGFYWFLRFVGRFQLALGRLSRPPGPMLGSVVL